MSKSDIQAGERWSVEIAKELEASNFGIICITKENLNAPWILFEAGALAKSMQNGSVIPLLLDIDFKEVTGPLAQFQAVKVESTGMKELVLGINKVAPTPVSEAKVTTLFSALWSDLDAKLSAIPSTPKPAKQSRPQGEILEELVAGIRTVELRIRDITDENSPTRNRKRSRSGLLDLAQISSRPGDPIQVLLLTSFVRDDFPWLYELAADLYRSALHVGPIALGRSKQQFLDALDIIERGSYVSDMGWDAYVFTALRRAVPGLRPQRSSSSKKPVEGAQSAKVIEPDTIEF